MKTTISQKLLGPVNFTLIDNNSTQNQKSKVATAKYEIEGVAGKGTFGVVYFGVNRATGEKIAIKKVFQDKKYKNR